MKYTLFCILVPFLVESASTQPVKGVAMNKKVKKGKKGSSSKRKPRSIELTQHSVLRDVIHNMETTCEHATLVTKNAAKEITTTPDGKPIPKKTPST